MAGCTADDQDGVERAVLVTHTQAVDDRGRTVPPGIVGLSRLMGGELLSSACRWKPWSWAWRRASTNSGVPWPPSRVTKTSMALQQVDQPGSADGAAAAGQAEAREPEGYAQTEHSRGLSCSRWRSRVYWSAHALAAGANPTKGKRRPEGPAFHICELRRLDRFPTDSKLVNTTRASISALVADVFHLAVVAQALEFLDRVHLDLLAHGVIRVSDVVVFLVLIQIEGEVIDSSLSA